MLFGGNNLGTSRWYLDQQSGRCVLCWNCHSDNSFCRDFDRLLNWISPISTVSTETPVHNWRHFIHIFTGCVRYYDGPVLLQVP